MEIHRTIGDFRNALQKERVRGRAVGFVPTMGALHDGHAVLMNRAAGECDVVAISIFVNPLQFGPDEDFSHYPRPFDQDVQRAASVGVSHVFAPSLEEVYPLGKPQAMVHVSGVTDILEGPLRPGHFDGVATVVAKLFAIVGPTAAYFGEKDWQQFEMIRVMVHDLSLPIEVIGCPIERDTDGLAQSSRNVYLDPDERHCALGLYGALRAGLDTYEAGERDSRIVCEAMEHVLTADSRVEMQYAAHVGPGMVTKATVEKGDRLLVAARRRFHQID